MLIDTKDRLSTEQLRELGKQFFYRQAKNGGTETWEEIGLTQDPPWHRDRVRWTARMWSRDNLDPQADGRSGRKVEFKNLEPLTETADQKRATWIEYVGSTHTIKLREPITNSENVRKVVAVGDFHGNPSVEVIAAVIKEQPDELVLGGDLLDGASISRWSATTKETSRQSTIREEITRMRAAIEMFLDYTAAKIKIIGGNHDHRASMLAAELLPRELLEFFRDPIDVLLEGLPADRIERINTKWRYNFPDKTSKEIGDSEYLLQMGDAILSHMNFSGGQAGQAVYKLDQWLHKWSLTLGLNNPTLLVQFHVHRVCMIECDGGNRMMVEPGAAFEPSVASYANSYEGKWSPSGIGCVYFEQQAINGKYVTDLSSVRLIRPHRGLPLAN